MENGCTFVAPEGVYSMTEEHVPHALIVHTQTVAPKTYPTRISTVTIRFPGPSNKAAGGTAGLVQLLGGNKQPSEAKKGSRDGADSGDETQDESEPSEPAPAAAHGDHHPFSHATKKKQTSRPKHNIRTTSSTFITRLQNVEGIHKILQSKQGESTFVFHNAAKTFIWVEAGSKSKEPLVRVTFSAFPTCHDVNTATATPERLDIVIGFSTGDILWLDPISARYARLNKQGSICNSPCTAVRWVPNSTQLFLVSHADGTIIVYDKDRDDGTFTPQEPAAEDGGPWNDLDSTFITMPPWHPASGPGLSGTKTEKDKVVKNPVSHWRVSKRGVVDFVFSPDVKYVAAISEDGCLRVIDALQEQLVDCYASYFGALTSVSWSPDGRFILTGGQDDLLTIFSPWEQRVVARCQGHSSFVSSVAFDDLRCDGRTYRFGSVGEDNKLIIWDFSSGALHRPKFQASHHQRMSMSSTISLAFRRDRSALYLPTTTGPGDVPGSDAPLARYHPAPARNEIAVVQPVLIKQLDGDLLTAIAFVPRSLLTVTRIGTVKVWVRPLALRPRTLRKYTDDGA